MSILKEYNGHFCESDYEYALISFLEKEGWEYLSGNDFPRLLKKDVINMILRVLYLKIMKSYQKKRLITCVI